MKDEMDIEVHLKIKPPKTPNFIRTGEDMSVAIGDLADDDLREIGRVWTESLIERAKEMRKNKR